MADLAANEPFSFKSVLEEVNKQTDLKSMIKFSAKSKKAHAVSYAEALSQGYLRETIPTKEELEIINT